MRNGDTPLSDGPPNVRTATEVVSSCASPGQFWPSQHHVGHPQVPNTCLAAPHLPFSRCDGHPMRNGDTPLSDGPPTVRTVTETMPTSASGCL